MTVIARMGATGPTLDVTLYAEMLVVFADDGDPLWRDERPPASRQTHRRCGHGILASRENLGGPGQWHLRPIR